MYSLKREAIQHKAVSRALPVPVLAQEFYRMVGRRGRSSEFWLVLRMLFAPIPWSFWACSAPGGPAAHRPAEAAPRTHPRYRQPAPRTGPTGGGVMASGLRIFPGCSLKGTGVAYEESLLELFRRSIFRSRSSRIGTAAAQPRTCLSTRARPSSFRPKPRPGSQGEHADLLAPCSACYLVLRKSPGLHAEVPAGRPRNGRLGQR